MILLNKVDLANLVGLDLIDLNSESSFTIDTAETYYVIAIYPALGGSAAQPNATITINGSTLSWTKNNNGKFAYIGPLDIGEYSISTGNTGYSDRNCFLSKCIPSVISYGNGISTTIRVPNNTGFNSLFLYGASYSYLDLFDNNKNYTKLGNRGYFLDESVTEIKVKEVVGTEWALLQFPEDISEKVIIKEGDSFTFNNSTCINFAGTKVKVELYGTSKSLYKGASYENYYIFAEGGKTEFVLDTKTLDNSIFSFNCEKSLGNYTDDTTYKGGPNRSDLIYGDTDDLYYRIAVAGSAGDLMNIGSKKYSKRSIPGAGGGASGGVPAQYYSDTYTPTPGTQTSGGRTNSWVSGATEYYGSFGKCGIAVRLE